MQYNAHVVIKKLCTAQQIGLHNRNEKKSCAKRVGIFQDFTLHALLTFALPYSKCELTTDRSVDEFD